MAYGRHRIGLAVVAAVLLIVPGCGSSPTGPSSVETSFDIAGTWSGTKHIEWDPMDGGGSCTKRVSASFRQSGAVVHGRLTDVDSVGCASTEEVEVSGDVRSPFVYLTLQAFPRAAPAMGHLDGDRLVINWNNVRWTLER